jgi:hypothetical protein
MYRMNNFAFELFYKHFLKLHLVFPRGMPKRRQISPVARIKVVREIPGQLGYCLQMILKPVPFSGWLPFSGMGVEFFFHEGISRKFELPSSRPGNENSFLSQALMARMACH